MFLPQNITSLSSGLINQSLATMFRFLISLLLYPLLQRFATSFVRSILTSIQNRQQREPRQETGTSYELDQDIIYGRVTHIVDGDSLYISRHEDQIRLWGVDAPEKHEPGYNEATQALSRLTMDREIEVQIVGTDKYGRTLARCFFEDGTEINYEMIKSGKVKEYLRFTKGYYSN